MKVIGLIGGMSWESSAQYYRIINETVRDRLGGVHSAKSLMWSMDFGEIERLQHDGNWLALTEEMIAAARRLEAGGADFLMICTNTMHKMAADVSAAVSIPLLHIADPTAEKIRTGTRSPARNTMRAIANGARASGASTQETSMPTPAAPAANRKPNPATRSHRQPAERPAAFLQDPSRGIFVLLTDSTIFCVPDAVKREPSAVLPLWWRHIDAAT